MSIPQILIVEDDHIIVMELEGRLQGLGYAVCAATSYGEDALQKVAALQPDLVLMDIRLKGAMDGIQTAAQIRDRFDIPVVYLTAHADADTLQRAKITEPYGYVIKPFEERELHTALEIALYKHEVERRLKQSRQWLAATLTSIGDAVMATDETGLIVFMNPAAEALTGWQTADALGKRVAGAFQILDEETRVLVENPVARALREGLVVDLAGHLMLAEKGQETPIDGSAALIRDEKGHIDGAVLVFRDISDQKRQQAERARLQARLFEAQKTEAVGALAGQMAHDFNNLMTTVIGFSSLLLSELIDKERQREGLEFVWQAGEQAASLTQQILTLSRRSRLERQVLNLSALVGGMQGIVQGLIGQDTDVVSAIEPGCMYVNADPGQIEQVLMNLILNAHEAMPEGGRLTLETETVTLDAAYCRQSAEAYPGTFVRLSVTDTGVGMDADTLEHVLEPFFTTKEKRTGLGLSIAHSIIAQYDGWMEVQSQPGRGSTFHVYLPACSEVLEPERHEARAPLKVQGAGEPILLVEDDPGVRMASAGMLRAGGYTVVAVAGTAQALDVFDQQGGAFDLVFSDVVLPDGDGLHLVHRLRAANPRLGVLMTSGYTDERAQSSIIRARGFRYLQKPFAMADLLSAVRQVLEAGHQGSTPPGPNA
jgi:two-component system cell cycle sensor histidine kinase/response regulator CckA